MSQIVGCAPQGGRDAMQEVARMTAANSYTHKIFIDGGLIYSEWGARFSFSKGGLARNN